MPLVEFECRDCDLRFEDLVRGEESPVCPSCGTGRVRRRLSTFGVAVRESSSGTPSPGGCGSCGDPRGPGACSLE